MTERNPVIGIIAGEESGQILAAELVGALTSRLGATVDLVGVGGSRLAEYGLHSLFDPDEIALMGVDAVIVRLPKLIARIAQTADALVAAGPDCLVLVDSPDFSLRVAKRVKARLPDLPVVKYVAPTVWAWRPGRAAQMAVYVDRVLAILPFEPAIMEQLGGPETHYVGHRLMSDDALTTCWENNHAREPDGPVQLLVLPGSRRSEVRALMDDFRRTAEILRERGNAVSIALPTLPHLEREVRDHVLGWSDLVSVTTSRDDQIAAFRKADIALCASGTVTLELALAGVPAISCYRTDAVMRVAISMISTWSAALPNLVADRLVIPEMYDHSIRPGMLARMIEQYVQPGSALRRLALDGYADVRRAMATDAPSSQTAAAIVADLMATGAIGDQR